jgi:hypothetical protein
LIGSLWYAFAQNSASRALLSILYITSPEFSEEASA